MRIQRATWSKGRKENKMTTYALNDTKVFMDIADGIAIVINAETGIYYGLNGLGTIVLEALAKGIDSDIVLQKLKNVSGAPAELASRLGAFIDELVEKELIIAGPAQNSEFIFDDEIAKEDHFEMVVKSYSDAQEMLLADPIHEVKEALGWTPEKESIGYTKEETKDRGKKIEQ